MFGGSEQRHNLRRRLRRHFFFALAKRYTPAVVAEWPDGSFIVNTWDDEIGLKTFRDGPYDADLLDMAVQRLTELLPGFSLAGKTVLEIGANIGTTTIPLIRRFGVEHVIAFEPSPHNSRIFAANIAANGLERQVTLHQLALSDRDGIEALNMNPGNSGDYRIVVQEDGHRPQAFGIGGEDRWETVDVRTTTLDDLACENLIDLEALSFVWIDVQGHEAHLLSGAKRLLASNVPVMIEYWPYGLDQAGGLERLELLLREHYDLFCEPDRPELRSTRVLPTLAPHKNEFWWWTNLIPLRRAWLAPE